MIKKLTPVVEYRDVPTSLEFYRKLGFEVLIQEGDPVTMAFVHRDNAEFQLVTYSRKEEPYAPAFRMMVEDVFALHQEIVDRAPEVLHPNVPKPITRPWGTTEFAVLDEQKICITIFTPTDELPVGGGE